MNDQDDPGYFQVCTLAILIMIAMLLAAYIADAMGWADLSSLL